MYREPLRVIAYAVLILFYLYKFSVMLKEPPSPSSRCMVKHHSIL